jgi:osmotically-inducible protein OsmY
MRPLVRRRIKILAASLLVVGTSCGCSSVHEPADTAQSSASADLAARVSAALRGNPYENDLHIEVFVENGAVVLRGLVEDEHALVEALSIARKAARGHTVINEITIMKTSAR